MKKLLPYNIIIAISLISSLNAFAQYFTEVDPSTRVLDKDNYRPGTLPGFIDINSLGESVYEIPIHIPPGTAGMQPSLSIAYNSNYPDGPLGIGWHIKGLSEIRRVPRNFYHHGMINGVDLQADDIFALDSNRLIITSQHAYGANGSEYRTEIETFSKITAYGTAGTGPSYFVVETKSGLTLEYGNTTDSKVEASGSSTVYMWRLNKVTDRNGNIMEYIYYEGNGESLIAEIKYTKNPSAGLNSHYNRVVFSYYSSSRTDYNTTYPAGKALPSTKLIESIQVLTEGDTLVREYGFKYVLNIYSHLNQITVTGSDGTKFNPTIIGWGDTKTPFYAYGYVLNNSQKNKFHYGDFNGDGRTDILAIERKTSYTSSDKWKLYYANSSGLGYKLCKEGTLSSSFKEFVVADVDGDGKDDILRRETQTVYYQCNPHPCDGPVYSISSSSTSSITNYVPPPPNDTCWDICSYQTESYLFYKATDSTLTRGSSSYDIPVSSSTAKLMPVELDGNGKSDFLLLTSSNNYNGIKGVTLSSPPNFNSPDDIRLLDFDGDGKKELLVHKGTSVIIYTWNPVTSQLTSIYTSSSWPGNPARVFIGDFNGDKKDDILYWNSMSWSLLLSTGAGFVTSTAPALRPYDPSASTTDNNYYIGDFNGDGKDDILEVYKYSTASRLKVHYSTGGGNFISETNDYSKSIINRDYFTITDMNGDNHADVFYYDYSSTANFVSACYFYAYENRHKVHKITNGLNHKIDLTYTRINDSLSFHTPGSSASFPLRDYNKGYYAVARVREYNDYTDTTKVEYSYKNAIFHAQGKGFLGFLEFSSKSSEDYKSINSFEINENFFIRMPSQFEYYKCFPNHNSLLRDIRYTNNVNNYGSKRFFPFISKTDTWDDIVKTITITESVYDYDGNLTDSEKRYLDEDSSLVATKRIINTYSQFGNWGVRNKVTKVITDSDFESDTLYRRLVTYSYDSNGNLTTQVADSGKTRAVTTSYLLNSLGMPYQKTVSSTGLTSRVETYEFDEKYRFIKRIINPAGNSAYFQYYPGTGNIRSHTDINGLRSEFEYDGFGRPKTNINEYDETISTTILWDVEDIVSNEILWSVQTNGTNVPGTSIWYDPLGREKQISINSNLRPYGVSKKYNSAGQLVEETTSNRTESSEYSYIKTSFDYDDFDRLSYTGIPGIGTVITYNGRETTEYLPGYKRRESTTDAMGNVLHIKENNNTNLTTSYVYHSSGQVKQTVSAGNTVTVDFDEYGRPETITSQNSGTEKYTFNAFGELTRTINAKGDTVSYNYDNLGRITSITEPEGTTTYSYVTSGNGLQQISSVSGPGVSYSYQYDSYGRLTQLSKTISNGPVLTVTYSYDSHGNIDEITYPGGFAISHLYDINGYLNEIRDAADNTIWKLYSLTGSGRPVSYDLGSGNISVS
ncbi:MAG: FG-GAP-like repeat-containing protein, partial [Bacteroidales bacterium]